MDLIIFRLRGERSLQFITSAPTLIETVLAATATQLLISSVIIPYFQIEDRAHGSAMSARAYSSVQYPRLTRPECYSIGAPYSCSSRNCWLQDGGEAGALECRFKDVVYCSMSLNSQARRVWTLLQNMTESLHSSASQVTQDVIFLPWAPPSRPLPGVN